MKGASEHRFDYPFAAIVGQEKMKKALILNVINPELSGVLIRGEKGTAKSTAVRSLADLLPEIRVNQHCGFQCSPDDPKNLCPNCREKQSNNQKPVIETRKIKVVELPISATEDRVIGTLDLEYALKEGKKKIEPGILASANRGILYVDEVNLLDDHVVDVLLDSAAMGVNTIEREGISFSHQSRFTLVGTMNPEEGELRPQLLDRFGLCVNIEGIQNPEQRVEIVKRRIEFEQDPKSFYEKWQDESDKIKEQITRAIDRIQSVTYSDSTLFAITERSLAVGVDGHRADIVILKAAKAITALNGRQEVTKTDIDEAAELALTHRMRRKPFENIR